MIAVDNYKLALFDSICSNFGACESSLVVVVVVDVVHRQTLSVVEALKRLKRHRIAAVAVYCFGAGSAALSVAACCDDYMRGNDAELCCGYGASNGAHLANGATRGYSRW